MQGVSLQRWTIQGPARLSMKGHVMAEHDKIEKFSIPELSHLRNELMQAGIDSRQAAEVVTTFLAMHGYGVKAELVPEILLRLEKAGCSVDCMQAELERVALVM